MHVVVVGCGRVGSGLAAELIARGHTVAIVDRDASAFAKRLPADWPGQAVQGSGFDRDVLDQAGISEADALVAVTSGDNTNILAARIARETYDVVNVVARIYDPGRATLYQRLGIPTVATVSWTIDQVLRKVVPAQTTPEWIDPLGGVRLVSRTVAPAWAGRRVADLHEGGELSVTAISRDAATTLASPDMIFQEGDVCHLMVGAMDDAALDALLESGGPEGAER